MLVSIIGRTPASRARARGAASRRGRSTPCSCSATWPDPASASLRRRRAGAAGAAPLGAAAHGRGRGAARDPPDPGGRARRPVGPARLPLTVSGRARSAPRAPAVCSRRRASWARPRRAVTRSARGLRPRGAEAVGGDRRVGPRDEPAFANAPSGIVTLRNVLPDWRVRLLVGALLLRSCSRRWTLRARRRREPIAPGWWLVVARCPLPVAWLWLRAAGRRARSTRPPAVRRPLSARDQRDRGDGVGAARRSSRALRSRLARVSAASAARGGARTVARGRRPGVDGLAVATASGSAALAASPGCFNPYAAGAAAPRRPPVAVRGAAGWRGRWAARASSRASCRPLLVARPLRPRARPRPARAGLGLGARGRGWRAALGRRCCSPACWPRSPGVVRVLLARRRIARDRAERGRRSARAGRVSYAGPGSLGGTESALRR